MQYPCTGVILAGGLSKRFSGTNKAFLRVRGQKIIDRLYAAFASVFQEIILVTNDPVDYLPWHLNIVSDVFAHRSSLTGIHAGLFFSLTPYAFVSACDAPFLGQEIIRTVLAEIRPNVDVVVPETSAGLEPLCAVYSRRCLGPITKHLQQERFKIRELYRKLRVIKIPEDRLRQTDPELHSFFNLNRPEDLATAEALARKIN